MASPIVTQMIVVDLDSSQLGVVEHKDRDIKALCVIFRVVGASEKRLVASPHNFEAVEALLVPKQILHGRPRRVDADSLDDLLLLYVVTKQTVAFRIFSILEDHKRKAIAVSDVVELFQRHAYPILLLVLHVVVQGAKLHPLDVRQAADHLRWLQNRYLGVLIEQSLSEAQLLFFRLQAFGNELLHKADFLAKYEVSLPLAVLDVFLVALHRLPLLLSPGLLRLVVLSIVGHLDLFVFCR